MSRAAFLVILLGPSVVALAVAWWLRPPLPPDELRYLAVGWETWRDGTFLVPHLNGEPYAHKPPLLFWLMHLGWAVFGVHLWWPRLLAPLAAALCLGAIAGAGRTLWLRLPAAERRARIRVAQCVFLGALLVQAFLSLVMFDLWLTAILAAGWWALLATVRGSGAAWLGVAAALALGILAKGPVALLFLMPALLAVHAWHEGDLPDSWWPRAALAVLGGLGAALAWALPAAAAGGPAYRDAILWTQTAGRAVDSFAHARPWWWYLPLLPVLAFPWSAWPAWWRRLPAPEHPKGANRHAEGDPLRAGRFLAWAALPPLLALTVSSGKQPHYLMPLLPLAALALAARLPLRANDSGPAVRNARLARLPVAALLSAGGVAILLLPALDPAWLAPWTARLDHGWAAALFLLAGTFLAAPAARWPEAEAGLLAAVMPTSLAVLHLVALPAMAPAHDLRPAARAAAQAQAAGEAVAWMGTPHHGQLHFPGRLREDVVVLQRSFRSVRWLRARPRACVLVHVAAGEEADWLGGARRAWPYRTGHLAQWDPVALAERLAEP